MNPTRKKHKAVRHPAPEHLEAFLRRFAGIILEDVDARVYFDTSSRSLKDEWARNCVRIAIASAKSRMPQLIAKARRHEEIVRLSARHEEKRLGRLSHSIKEADVRRRRRTGSESGIPW